MKKLTLIMIISCCLLLSACDNNATQQGIELPFSLEDILEIELTYHTGDPANAQQKIVTGLEDINYIHSLFSSEIHLEQRKKDYTNPSAVLRIRFCLNDGHGYSMEYQSIGVKKGLLSSSDGDFAYSTPTDVIWLWEQLTNEYEVTSVPLAPVGATEQPLEIQ